MSKIKLTELTNKSSLVDVDSNEAAEVSGGNGWYPNLYNDTFYPSLGYNSIPAYYLNQNSFTGYEPNFSNSGIAGIDANVSGILTPLYQNGVIS